MKEKILIVSIVILLLAAIGIGVFIIITPTKVPEKKEILFPDNKMVSTLEIQKLNREIPRMYAIKNYPKNLQMNEINSIKTLRYHILNENAAEHMLIVPFKTGGKITVGKMIYDEYKEKYICSEKSEDLIISEQITPDYSLLLKYNRPTSGTPEIYIKITEGEKTATYIVNALKSNQQVNTIEQVKQDTNIKEGLIIDEPVVEDEEGKEKTNDEEQDIDN